MLQKHQTAADLINSQHMTTSCIKLNLLFSGLQGRHQVPKCWVGNKHPEEWLDQGICLWYTKYGNSIGMADQQLDHKWYASQPLPCYLAMLEKSSGQGLRATSSRVRKEQRPLLQQLCRNPVLPQPCECGSCPVSLPSHWVRPHHQQTPQPWSRKRSNKALRPLIPPKVWNSE